MRKILIGPSSFAAQDDGALQLLKQRGFQPVNNPYGRKLSKAELLELLPGIEGIVAGLETIDREVLEKSNLKVVSRCGSGVSNVDLKAAAELGIAVKTTPDAPVNAVAELTVGMMIAACRKAGEMNHKLHAGEWYKTIGFELKNKNVIIVGFGRIGRRVAELLIPFHVNLIIVDPWVKDVPAPMQLMPFDKAISLADIMTLHASGEDVLIGAAQFERLKKGVVLLNPARGGLIDERALADSLKKGVVAAAWLDTFKEEPYQGELTQFQQVILTPHIGSYSRECRRDMELQAVQNLLEALNEAV